MNKRIWKVGLAVVAALALLFSVGFTQDEDDPIGEPENEYEPEYGEDVPLPIITTLSEYGSLETFLELIEKAGLLEELEGDGPLTVFVPDDSAFAQLQPDQLEKLLSDDKFLKEVLSRHIVSGHRVEFEDGPEELTVKAINGDVISIEITEESVRVGRAWVIDEQVECSNGLIHVIDAVLLPNKGQRKG